MRRTYLWMLFLAIGLGAVACTTTPSEGESDKMENVKKEGAEIANSGANAEVSKALEGLFRWYINRPENAHLTTGYNDQEMAIVENKASFLAAFRGSGHFSADFANRLEKQYDDCEKQYGAEELDEHLPCLEIDPVTIKAGFDQFVAIEIFGESPNGDQNTVKLKLSGKKELSAGATQDRTVTLKVNLIKSNGKWVADRIGE